MHPAGSGSEDRALDCVAETAAAYDEWIDVMKGQRRIGTLAARGVHLFDLPANRTDPVRG